MDGELYDYSGRVISKEEAQNVYAIQKVLLNSWAMSKDSMTVEQWLNSTLKNQLPDKDETEIREISDEIVDYLRVTEKKKTELEEAVAIGRDKKSWLASELEKSASHMSAQESARYLIGLDEAVKDANVKMYNTIIAKTGQPNMNPNLDGFIAEAKHINSFNLKAEAVGSNLRAEVGNKPGMRYSENGFDIVVNGPNGRVQQYQVKYGATAEATIEMIKRGNYDNQRLLVPEEQVEAVQKAFPNKTVTSKIEADGISSDPLSKVDAKKMQGEAQDGSFLETDWSDFSNKDIAFGIAGEVGKATLMGAAVGVGMNLLNDVAKGEPIDGEEIVETALTTGTDFGVKAAVTGGLKVASEKGILTCIPKGTPAGTLASIAFVGVEDAKVLSKVAKGELTPREGVDKLEQTTASCVAGIAAATKGGSIGASIGSVFGPVGTAVGGFIGSTVGYIAGSKVGETVVKGAQKVRDCVVKAAKAVGNAVKDFAHSFARGIADLLGI
ncbi:MAG: hypothetical protein J5626_08555 [Lachnospiraceae bacterium]|nr:hypothetical protein [Lachnospiraceae bacterium]